MRTDRLAGGVLLGVGLTLVYRGIRGPRYSFGGDSTDKLDRDPAKLLPSFARRLEQLFRNMRALGFDPYLHEGYRSPERSTELADSGVLAARDSMHNYGGAADIRSASRFWAWPEFFDALAIEGPKVGLQVNIPGGGDANHVQVPGNLQRRFRAASTVAARDAIARQAYA